MFKNLCVLLGALFFINLTNAMDLSLASSSDDLFLGVWSSPDDSKYLGYYGQVFGDFQEYENGEQVSVCRDGQISGSTGSGTCSGHGGVSHRKNAEFDRFGLTMGVVYALSQQLELHGGILAAIYSSDVNVGETSEKDFTEIGLDVGASYRLPSQSRSKLLIGYESEQERIYFGLKYAL